MVRRAIARTVSSPRTSARAAFYERGTALHSNAFGVQTRSRPTPTCCALRQPASAARITSAGRSACGGRRASHLGSGKDYKSWLAQRRRAGARRTRPGARPVAAAASATARRVGHDRARCELAEASVDVIVRQQRARARSRPAAIHDATASAAARRLASAARSRCRTSTRPPRGRTRPIVRAMNENSWLYYRDWFWYLGWFEHRFAVQTSVLPRPRVARGAA